jgi:hypothetical protein
MIRNARARGIVIWSRSVDAAALRLAKEADEKLVCGKKIQGYLVLFDAAEQEMRDKLARADLEGVSAGKPRQTANQVFARLGLDPKTAQVVFLVDNNEVTALWVLQSGELTEEQIQKILKTANAGH